MGRNRLAQRDERECPPAKIVKLPFRPMHQSIRRNRFVFGQNRRPASLKSRRERVVVDVQEHRESSRVATGKRTAWLAGDREPNRPAKAETARVVCRSRSK